MLENLHFTKFILTVTARDSISLPPYKGSTFRGGFGNAFKRIVCIGKNKECETCLLKSRCIYVYIFETPPPEDTVIMRKYRTAPHPFVIEPPMSPRFTERNGNPLADTKTIFEPGEKLSFSLILIGKAIDSLPYFIYTFEELGNSGIGKGRGRYSLDGVYTGKDNSELIYSSTDKKLKGSVKPETVVNDKIVDTPSFISSAGKVGTDLKVCPYRGHFSELCLSFLTPTRIVYDGHLTEKPEFHVLTRNLLRRIAHLSYFHCGGDPSGFDFTGVIDRAMKISLKEENLQWYDWERYSARQDTRMKLGGFIGNITFEGDLGEFIPYIRAGEAVHIGKGTSFGLGKYNMKDDQCSL